MAVDKGNGTRPGPAVKEAVTAVGALDKNQGTPLCHELVPIWTDVFQDTFPLAYMPDGHQSVVGRNDPEIGIQNQLGAIGTHRITRFTRTRRIRNPGAGKEQHGQRCHQKKSCFHMLYF